MLRPYFINFSLNRSIKQLPRRARKPRPILFVELKACQMADDTGHRHRALTPWRVEVELEIVVFYERVAADVVLYQY